jgi:hypothetical protein
MVEKILLRDPPTMSTPLPFEKGQVDPVFLRHAPYYRRKA